MTFSWNMAHDGSAGYLKSWHQNTLFDITNVSNRFDYNAINIIQYFAIIHLKERVANGIEFMIKSYNEWGILKDVPIHDRQMAICWTNSPAKTAIGTVFVSILATFHGSNWMYAWKVCITLSIYTTVCLQVYRVFISRINVFPLLPLILGALLKSTTMYKPFMFMTFFFLVFE